jgi:hypothetical protein
LCEARTSQGFDAQRRGTFGPQAVSDADVIPRLKHSELDSLPVQENFTVRRDGVRQRRVPLPDHHFAIDQVNSLKNPVSHLRERIGDRGRLGFQCSILVLAYETGTVRSRT